MRWVAAQILREAGYYVIEAASAEQALRIARDTDVVDLLLCDVLLPGAHGGQAAEDLRHARPGLPILFMSGFPDDALVRRTLSRGRAEFLLKPFCPADLLHKVAGLLEENERALISSSDQSRS